MNEATKKVNITGTNESVYLVQDTPKKDVRQLRSPEPTALNDLASVLLVPAAIMLCLLVNLIFFMSLVNWGWFKLIFLPAITTYISITYSLKFVDWLRDNFFSWKQ